MNGTDYLVDSNYIIYFSKGDNEIATFFEEVQRRRNKLYISIITYLEVWGYWNLSDEEKEFLNTIRPAFIIIPLSLKIADKAIFLRQNMKIKLADAVIAATALVHGLSLVTNNIDDFKNIQNLNLLNIISK
ncbi:MAG: type II toxin-antitoxin system VapC family toxin [archaeon GB-1867-035]|nr:type II toxin-antitoxin system VapC family toxin [Candidatus Culexmicrobium profundum]